MMGKVEATTERQIYDHENCSYFFQIQSYQASVTPYKYRAKNFSSTK